MTYRFASTADTSAAGLETVGGPMLESSTSRQVAVTHAEARASTGSSKEACVSSLPSDDHESASSMSLVSLSCSRDMAL